MKEKDKIIDVVDDGKKPSKFKQFFKANKIYLILIFVGLLFLFSVIFTSVANKNKQDNGEGIKTELIDSDPSFFYPRKEVIKLDPQNGAIEYILPVDSVNFMYVSSLNDVKLITWTDGSYLYVNYDSVDNEIYLYLNDGQSNNVYVVNRYSYSGTGYNYNLNSVPVGVLVDPHEYNRTTFSNIIAGSSTISYSTFVSVSYYNDLEITQNLYSLGFSDIEQSYLRGENDGENNVLDSPNTYDLYTYDQYQSRYSEGVEYGINHAVQDLSIKGLIFAIFSAPSQLLDMFNFTIFGINIKSLVTFLITLAVIVWVIALFKKRS